MGISLRGVLHQLAARKRLTIKKIPPFVPETLFVSANHLLAGRIH